MSTRITAAFTATKPDPQPAKCKEPDYPQSTIRKRAASIEKWKTSKSGKKTAGAILGGAGSKKTVAYGKTLMLKVSGRVCGLKFFGEFTRRPSRRKKLQQKKWIPPPSWRKQRI
jgi:hypothetical protein